ncbi:carbohydrate ABC transporter permease [Cohnella candidum]|uniref:Carbohydrate ABC transporter permease n=1 Tax=Cohnella candidum TaxID=2674991 RepID=A0A3G3JXR7_9BACL|nr:carbohydrate ABC transporter permease [Cohnella candidum]AYQ73024.1 carbohydrate ABC transporter permease [Cohnella candidum]
MQARLVEHHSGKHQVVSSLMYAALVVFAVLMIFPMLWMAVSAFKPMDEIFSHPVTLVPKSPTLENFKGLFEAMPFARNLLNSAYVAVVSTAASLFFCALGGFGFAKYAFRFKGPLFLLLLGSMMIPQEVLMIPLYVEFQKLHWIDTHWGLIIPGMANAFGIFFMKQFIESLPEELMEAARIDGLGEFGIFTRIVLPIIRPAFASLGIIFFMNSWNNFLWPLILLKSEGMYTLTVAIYSITGGIREPFHIIMAGSFVSVLPLMIIFLIFQRQFIAGITSGAVKG